MYAHDAGSGARTLLENPARQETPAQGAAVVLNVNDNDASRYLVSSMLEQAGFSVLEASSGQQALDLARATLPSVVVLDIKLPDIDGLEVCRRLKSDPHTQPIKVLHTSAVYVSPEYKVQSLECGADGYLGHPFEQEELVATLRSLLRLSEAERSLRAQAEELKAANRRTNEFLAMLAHELRNPLAAIVTSLPLLERSAAVDSLEKTARELIRRQTTHLRRLVDDLLDAARVTQGKIDLRWETIDLNDLVRRVAANAERTKMQPRNQALRLALPTAQMFVRCDPMRLEQVLTNLLDNASKYSNSGDVIDFSLTRTRQPETGADMAQIVVRDRGIGMAPETLPTIFDLFSQADVPLARSRGGLGIGLTLVRTLVDLHGGATRARSDGLGKGSEFEITLPLTMAHTQATGPADAPVRSSHVHARRRVLIVEDNRDAQEALQCLLELWGHEVFVAGDGTAGCAAAVTVRPDVALIDLGLPALDGYEVAKRVRATLGAASPLLIALTGYGAPEQRTQALAAGFDLHIVKPVEPERLATLLEEYAATPPTSARQAEQAASVETTATNLRTLA
ncbi:MAG TPA: response regulator [Steroidobacteraceae bacterium]|nr:response regulator [Steroidobacteraceae bacterium]